MWSVKLGFALICVLFISQGTQAEWSKIQCLTKCTDKTCTTSSQQELCRQNCPSNTIEACLSAKSLSPSQNVPQPLKQSQPANVPQKSGTQPSSDAAARVSLNDQGRQSPNSPFARGVPLKRQDARKDFAISDHRAELDGNQVATHMEDQKAGIRQSGVFSPQPAVTQEKPSSDVPSGFVSKKRCDLCGTPTCGTDQKLLGDCRVCGTTNEKFDQCLELAKKAGFLDKRKEGIQASIQSDQADSLRLSFEKIKGLIAMANSLRPLVMRIASDEQQKKEQSSIDYIYNNLQEEHKRLQVEIQRREKEGYQNKGEKVATSPEKLSGLKTGMYGIRAYVCMQLVAEAKEKQTPAKSKFNFFKKKDSKQNDSKQKATQEKIEKLQTLCNQGNSLALQDIKLTLENLKEMQGVVDELNGFEKQVVTATQPDFFPNYTCEEKKKHIQAHNGIKSAYGQEGYTKKEEAFILKGCS